MQIKHLMPVLLVELPAAQGLARIPELLHSSHKGLEIFEDVAASPGVRHSMESKFNISMVTPGV